MTSPNLALQKALVATFRTLDTAAEDRFYSKIPDNAAYPYGQVWEGYEVPVDEDCSDRTESTLQVDIWADAQAYIKAKETAKAIRDFLHENDAALTVDGHVVDRIRVETINYTAGPPHYRARLSIVVETQPA